MRYRSILLGLVGLFALAASATAQTAVPNSQLAWDQPAGTLADASSMTYEATFDGAAFGALTSVVCSGIASPYVCRAAWPQLTPATHTVQIRAVRVDGTNRYASPLSAVFNFTFVALPEAPRNLRIFVTP